MQGFSSAAEPDHQLTPRFFAAAIKGCLRPVQLVMACPTLLFLFALTAMLFCHPDVPFHKLNRVTFGVLVVGVIGKALVSKHKAVPFERASWPMIALTMVMLISLIGRPIDDETLGVLGAKYLFPFTLFHVAKHVFTGEKEVRRFEVFALVVLTYLSFTAIAFLLGAHALVFPKFILDPNLGYHVERARGPFLQAVANGVSLNMLALLVLHGYRRGSLRSVKTVIVLGSVPLAILATMTRAVWLSFAGSVLALLMLSRNRRLRLSLGILLALGAGGLALAMSATQLGAAVDDRVSQDAPVEYRKAVYAGGWRMFLDRPLMGWGFHQMPAELPKYVDEFHEKLLYPHNTYLEVAVENGLLGLSLYMWLMWELLRLGSSRLRGQKPHDLLNSEFHRMWPIFLAVYCVNAAVVVMSYQFVNGLLFSVAGILAAQRRRAEAVAAC
ncbi:MAG TPA: O-antigen ligase family protein [Candidatus Binatia bacterium]|nr:O-antigen ligase family protein [Candidatus Binatia bacterium]